MNHAWPTHVKRPRMPNTLENQSKRIQYCCNYNQSCKQRYNGSIKNKKCKCEKTRRDRQKEKRDGRKEGKRGENHERDLHQVMVCLKLMFLIVFAFRSFCVLTMQVSLRHKASAKSSVAAAMLLKCCPHRDAPTRGCLTQSSPTVSAANGRIFCRAWNAVLPDSKTSAKSSWANMIY